MALSVRFDMDGIKAVLFDIDGTLANSMEGALACMAHAVSVHGFPSYPREVVWPLLSKRLLDVCSILYPGSDTGAFMETYRSFQRANMSMNTPIDGALELVSTLKRRGFKLAVLSNRTSHTLHDLVRQIGVAEYLDLVVPSDHVSHPKPHPEIVLKAVDMLAVSPERCVVVGDAPSDVQVGQAAGTKTIAVLVGVHTREELVHAEPDYIVETLFDILPLLEKRYGV